MVASKMGLLRRTAKLELVIHECWFGFGFWMLSFVFILCLRMGDVTFVKFLCLADLVTGQDRLQLMSRLSTVTFSILVNRPPTGIFSIIGVWVKWIVGATGFLFWFPGGKGNWDFTLLYRRPYIIFFWRCTTELSYLSCLLLFFETPKLIMKWVLWKTIGSCLRL